jgi:hypothetical protein
MSTKQKLAAVLNAHGLNDMAIKAAHGFYDDYESELDTPALQLIHDLNAAKAFDLARRAMHGEFDATREEGQAWFDREGHKLINGGKK